MIYASPVIICHCTRDGLKTKKPFCKYQLSKDRVAALSRRAELYVINRENVEWLVKHYAGRRLPFDMLVIDELSSFKNSKAKRFVALKRVLGQFTRVVGLTGTPAPNGLEDLWPQIFLTNSLISMGQSPLAVLLALQRLQQLRRHKPVTAAHLDVGKVAAPHAPADHVDG